MDRLNSVNDAQIIQFLLNAQSQWQPIPLLHEKENFSLSCYLIMYNHNSSNHDIQTAESE